MLKILLLVNQNSPWAAYKAFIFGRLIALNKRPGIRPVGVGETWRHIFTKFVLRLAGPEATNTCQYDHICSRLKVLIYGFIHGVKDIWDANVFTED